MAREFKVRIATPEDVHDVMDMAMAYVNETGMVDGDPETILNQIWPALNRWCGIVGVIGRPREKAEGCVFIGISNIWYSKTQIVDEKFTYVRPEFRSQNGAEGGRATKLLEFSKSVSNSLEMPMFVGGADAALTKETKGKRRLYSRMFGSQVGAYFLYNSNLLKAAHSPALDMVEG